MVAQGSGAAWPVGGSCRKLGVSRPSEGGARGLATRAGGPAEVNM
jgi:hypothetical protein